VTLAPTKSCTLAVAFLPKSAAALAASLTLTDNTSSSPQQVALSGTGIVGLTIKKSSLVFGDVKFGAEQERTFDVVNHQTQSVTLSENFSGPNAGDFSVTGGTCGTTLGARSKCSVVVSFSPGALGTESATLSIADSPDPLSPYTVALTTGPTIPATVAPDKLEYGKLTAKTSPKTKDVTITNNSGFPLSVSESFSGANANDFAVTGGTCGSTAPANSSCTIAVTFTPTGGGSQKHASMAVSIGNDPTSPHDITLTGTGP
jgi:trimeric autotransporter adhesin